MKVITVALGLIAFAAAFAPAFAAVTHWEFAPGTNGSEIKFVSKAPVESFEGKTSAVSGRLALDPDSGGLLDLRVVVDMATLDTGIKMRNGHMRKNHLHTDEFPTATFAGGEIVSGDGPLPAQGELELVVEGTLTLHGVEREVRIPVTLSREGDAVRVRCEFQVRLSDYEIPRPRFLIMKLGEEQRIVVDILAIPEGPAAETP